MNDDGVEVKLFGTILLQVVSKCLFSSLNKQDEKCEWHPKMDQRVVCAGLVELFCPTFGLKRYQPS